MTLRTIRIFHRKVLRDVTISVPKSGLIYIVGANNSGKSLLTGCLEAKNSDIAFLDEDEERYYEWSVDPLPEIPPPHGQGFLDHLVVGYGERRTPKGTDQYVIFDELPSQYSGLTATTRPPAASGYKSRPGRTTKLSWQSGNPEEQVSSSMLT